MFARSCRGLPRSAHRRERRGPAGLAVRNFARLIVIAIAAGTTPARRQQDLCGDRGGARRLVRHRLPDNAGGCSVTGDPSAGWTFLGPGIALVATIAVTVFPPTGRIAWGAPLPPERAGEPRAAAPGRHRLFGAARASRFAACCVRCVQGRRGNRRRARRHDAGVRGSLSGRVFPGARICHLAERAAPLIANSRRGDPPRITLRRHLLAHPLAHLISGCSRSRSFADLRMLI
jgi:hypothetical protein